jgi:hypothetical protein
VVRRPDPHERFLHPRLNLATFTVWGLTGVILAAALVAHLEEEQEAGSQAGSEGASSSTAGSDEGNQSQARAFACAVLAVFAFLIAVPFLGICHERHGTVSAKESQQATSGEDLAANLLGSAAPLSSSDHAEASRPVPGPSQQGPCEALRTLDCWLLMWADAWAQAAGGMVAASMGQLVEANGASDFVFFTSLFSVGNTCGRALLGTLSDAAVRRGVPRAASLVLISALITVYGIVGARTHGAFTLYLFTRISS